MKKYISDIMPFKMYGNLYFVGSSRVSVHIVKTDVGLVMLDSGYPDMYEQIADSMAFLGLDPKEICAIFHSHGHIDHFGCTSKFKEISGAETYISTIDNHIVNGERDLSWARELGYKTPVPFECDVLIEDGDTFSFGDTTIRCLLTPGHTEGVLTFFVNIGSGEKEIIAAMHGGIGRNSMTVEFLNKYGLSLGLRDEFRNGLHRLANERVELVMGNHPDQNDTYGKLEKVLAGESIIAPDEWKTFLINTEKKLDEMMASQSTHT